MPNTVLALIALSGIQKMEKFIQIPVNTQFTVKKKFGGGMCTAQRKSATLFEVTDDSLPVDKRTSTVTLSVMVDTYEVV